MRPHNSYFCVILCFIVCAATSSEQKEGTLQVSINPKEPRENQQTSITCAVQSSTIRSFHYMSLTIRGEIVFVYMFSTNNADRQNNWKNRNVQHKFDTNSLTLTVTVSVDRRDNGKLKCTMLRNSYPNSELDMVKTIDLHVQKAPRIKSLQLFKVMERKTIEATSDLTFLENSRIKAICNVDDGYPRATTTIDSPGIFYYKSNEDNKNKGADGYYTSRVDETVTVNDKDDGAMFVCNSKNRNGDFTKKKTIHVLYVVRDLKFNYHSGTKIAVGQSITCSARGNPKPFVNITVIPLANTSRHDFAEGGSMAWTSNSSIGKSTSSKKIPLNAVPGSYNIRCIAWNIVQGRRRNQDSGLVRINITEVQKAGVGLILGITIPLLLLFLIIVFCCCKSRRRRKRKKRDEEAALDYRLNTRPVGGPAGRRKRPELEDRLGKKNKRNKADDGNHTNSGATSTNDVLGSAEPSKTVWSDVSAFTTCETRWQCHGASSSGLGNSYQREEDPEYPSTPRTSLNSPMKPPRSITSSSSNRGLNHKHLDNRDAYSPADGASVPFTAEVVATIDDPHNKSLEAEEEFV